jgi:hypothetical protein
MGWFSSMSKKPSKYLCSISSNAGDNYSHILNQLEQLVYSVACYTYCEIGVVVQVHKLSEKYCSISCQLLADSSFRNVSFAEGFKYNGEDLAQFETEFATGFTTPEDVKRELLLQFNWPDMDISITKTEINIYNSGIYLDKPCVSYSFTMRGSGQGF